MIAIPTLHSHTHCQAPRANAKTKACQRVCLSQRTADSAAKLIDNEIKRQKSPVPNKRYKTLGFKWLCEVPAPHQSLVYLDRNVARNPQRFHTANRYR